MLRIEQPILTNEQLASIKAIDRPGLKSITLPILYKAAEGGAGMEKALEDLCEKASQATEDGYSILILSDRNADETNAPVPSLIAASAVHYHLIDKFQRTKCGIILESAEPREVHHYCVLAGYGVAAVNPYLTMASIDAQVKEGLISCDFDKAVKNYIKAVGKGMLKTMGKMGISTLHSYRGAQIFEAVGLSKHIVDRFFKGTASRIQGIGLNEIAREVSMRHEKAYPSREIPAKLSLEGRWSVQMAPWRGTPPPESNSYR